MAYVTRRVTLTTTATRIDAQGSRLMIVAQGSGTIVLGPAGVTAATGCRIPVVAGTVIDDTPESPGEALYGILASGTLDVDVLLGGA